MQPLQEALIILLAPKLDNVILACKLQVCEAVCCVCRMDRRHPQAWLVASQTQLL